MKIKISSFCWICFDNTDQSKEAYEKLKEDLNGNEEIEVEFNNENLYEFICPKGHKTLTQLQEQKFELLFDLGALALLDGYSKEAVSTFASSFERFIEFFIQVVSFHHKVTLDNFSNTWKEIASQSERQLGAFYTFQLIEFGETKYVLDKKWIEFRNKVIHKGYIPKSHEAIAYGNYILSLIFKILTDLKKNHLDAIQTVGRQRIFNSGEKIPTEIRHAKSTIPTIINLRSIRTKEFGGLSFSDALESIRRNSFYKTFYVKKI